MSFRLSNRDDISLHVDGKTSINVLMAKYVTETKGISGRKEQEQFYIYK